MNKKTLKDWKSEDKPREKLINKGINSLSDAELIAILIGSGNADMNAVDLARTILIENKNNLNNISKLSVLDLQKYKGIGQAKAVSIVAALELGKRRSASEIVENPIVRYSKDAFDYMYHLFADLQHEEFWVILLNRKNQITARKKIAQGGVHSLNLDMRLLMKFAIENLAGAIIISHNHPSGNLNPSKNDIELTKNIKRAGEILNIKLIDHLIFSNNKYFSFADENLLR